MRHAIERATQATGRFAAAAALPAARFARATPPQGERVAITALLQRLLEREAPRLFDRAKLWLEFQSRLEHGGQHGKFLVVLLFGVSHGQTLPSRGALLRPRFIVCTIANGSHACKIVVTSSAKPVRSKERAGVGLLFVRPVSFARSKLEEIIEGSGTPANADPYPPHLATRLAPCGAFACRRSTTALT
jgi:hypothetical protein